MPRRACTFRESDVRRALRAAKAVGVKVRVEIEASKMTLVPVEEDADEAHQQQSDEVERWVGKHAHKS